MARVSSRLSSQPQTLLRNSIRCIFREGGLLGETDQQVLQAGYIPSASFESPSADQQGLIGSESPQSRIRVSGRGRGADPNSQHWVGWSTTGLGQVGPRLQCQIASSGGSSSQTTSYGSLGFSRMYSQSIVTPPPPPRAKAPIIKTGPDGSQKVIARISNVPKFVFKSDLLSLFEGCSLTEEDFTYVYDSKYRVKFIQITLPSVGSYQQAQRLVASRGRFGGRYIKFTSEEFLMDDLNEVLTPFRGRSLLMLKVQIGVMTEDVERFFCGYTLDWNYPIKFLRSPIQVPVYGAGGSVLQMKTEFEMRTLVRFISELEALRALREKQGSFCLDKPMDLRYIS